MRRRGDLLIDDAGNVVGVCTAPLPPRRPKPVSQRIESRKAVQRVEPPSGPRPLTADQAAKVERYLSPEGPTAAEVLALPVDLQRLLLTEAREPTGGADSHLPTADEVEAVCAPARERQDAERDWQALHRERERLRMREYHRELARLRRRLERRVAAVR